jgi:hypothetical protein
MEESVAGPVRKHDKAIPLIRVVPFHFGPNRLGGRFIELRFGRLRRSLGMALRVPGIRLFDDLFSRVMNVSASL